MDSENPTRVYATGYEASVYLSTNRGETWARLRGFNFKNGNRVIPDPRDRSKIFVATYGSSVWYGPADGAPETEEDIATPVVRFDHK